MPRIRFWFSRIPGFAHGAWWIIIATGLSTALGAFPQSNPVKPAPAASGPAPEVPAPAAPVAMVPYTVTEVEALKLKLAQKDVQLAQISYMAAVNAFNGQVKTIRDGHGWPDAVTFNANTLEFQGPPAAPAIPPPADPSRPAK